MRGGANRGGSVRPQVWVGLEREACKGVPLDFNSYTNY